MYRLQYQWPNTPQLAESIEPIESNSCDGLLALIHKETVVQLILRSPYLLSSQGFMPSQQSWRLVPSDFADLLRKPFTEEELELEKAQDAMPRLSHRLSYVSNGSELSFRNSVKESDSEFGDPRTDEAGSEMISGSLYLYEHPETQFEEMMNQVKTMQETKLETQIGLHQSANCIEVNPGKLNTVVSLILCHVC